MDFKLLGSILLIVGTSIGAGMLALPIATAQLGFVGSLILLFACWFVMTAGAFLILEVNLWMPKNSNLITMARTTIGPVGQIISWINYLLLLYSLLCAYLAGGSDLFHNLFMSQAINVPTWLSSIIFVTLFGTIVFFGIRTIDYTNRVLMLIKFSAYFLLLFFLTPFVSIPKLADGDIQQITSATAIMVTITSFGYSAIVPSLRVYFNDDIAKLKKAIIIGSLIPLICYIAWDMVIMGVIPLHGPNGLISILSSENSTSNLVNTLSAQANNKSVTFFTKLFTSVCVLTSFLGVSLCLVDFLADGLNIEKKGIKKVYINLLTFLPPLITVLFFPGIFVQALKYAGIYCLVLLILLPAWMAWAGRKNHPSESFKVSGGKPLLLVLIVFSIIMIVKGFIG